MNGATPPSKEPSWVGYSGYLKTARMSSRPESPLSLKRLSVDGKDPKPFQRVTEFLEEHLEWMTAYLRHAEVKRNSLAESGMRFLRRLAIDHDGFWSEKGRNNRLRIYQTAKYLGWSVYRPPWLENS